MTRFFVDGAGRYLGGFDGEAALAKVPPGSIEVPTAPEHAAQIWGGSQWGAPPPADARTDAEVIVDDLLRKGLVTEDDLDDRIKPSQRGATRGS